MSFESHGNIPKSNNDYKFSGVHQGNVNQAFHSDHLQPPPEYEDVISGRQTEQIGYPQEQEPAAHVVRQVIFVTPDYEAIRRKRLITVLGIILVVLIIPGLIKIFTF